MSCLEDNWELVQKYQVCDYLGCVTVDAYMKGRSWIMVPYLPLSEGGTKYLPR